MRCFVALLPEPAFLAALGSYMQPLSQALAGWRWVRPEGAHITLGFLGELAEADVVHVGKAIAAIQSWASFGGMDSSDVHSLSSMRFSRLARFPPSGRPRTLVLAPDDAQSAVQQCLGRIRVQLGHCLSAHAYSSVFSGPCTAHVSLARAKDGRPALPKTVDIPYAMTGPFCFGRLGLMESLLGPGGSRYRLLAQATLVKPAYNAESNTGGKP